MTPAQEPRRQGRDSAVEALVEAARALFAERGPDAVSLRDIARRAGVNHGLIHHYIGSRDDLLRLVFDAGWGRVITISSGAGTAGVNIGVSPYSAGKGGGIAFTRTLALEVARSGVTANSLAIGLMGVRDETVTGQLARAIPVGRVGAPADIAAACVWLASDEASWVTAQTIQINGGSVAT